MFLQHRTNNARPAPPFRVFADAQSPSASLQAKAGRFQVSTSASTSNATCMVLKELNTNKGFKLSPNSQIRAEKENFDPIKKQLIYYKRSNSKAVPLEEKMVRAYSRVVGERVVGVRANKLHHNNAIQSKYTVESHRFVNEYTTPTGVRVLARHSAVPANKYKKEAVVAGNRKAMDGNSSQHTFCAKPRREVDDLVQLLDGMDLSIESPVFASDKENEQQCVRDKALLRLSLPPPTLLPHRMQKRTTSFASRIVRSSNVELQGINMRSNKASTRLRSSSEAIPTNRITTGRPYNNVNKSQTPNQRNNKNDGARRTQIHVNLLTPPELRYNMR